MTVKTLDNAWVRQRRAALKLLPFPRFFNEWLERIDRKAWEVAPLLKVAVSMVYEYRKGAASPGIDKVPRFAPIMGVSERQLIDLLLKDAKARRAGGFNSNE